MGISINVVNTGVIRKSNNFIALEQKIKEPRKKEAYIFVCGRRLRSLLIGTESG